MKSISIITFAACALAVSGCSSSPQYDDLPKNSVSQNREELDKIKNDTKMPDYMKNAILNSKPAKEAASK